MTGIEKTMTRRWIRPPVYSHRRMLRPTIVYVSVKE